MLPSATNCLENEFDLIQVNLLKTNLGFRLKRGDVYGLGLALCTQKIVKGRAVASVTQLDSACVCVRGCAWTGVVCVLQERVLEGPQRLVVSADPNSSGVLKDSCSQLFWSKRFVYKAGCSR